MLNSTELTIIEGIFILSCLQPGVLLKHVVVQVDALYHNLGLHGFAILAPNRPIRLPDETWPEGLWEERQTATCAVVLLVRDAAVAQAVRVQHHFESIPTFTIAQSQTGYVRQNFRLE